MYYFLAAMMDSLYYIRVMVYQFYPSQLNIIIFLSHILTKNWSATAKPKPHTRKSPKLH
jgi:hypothetical protein